MLGLMFILVYGACLLVIPAVLGIAVWRWAIKRGKARAWSWGVAAALVIPVWAFWDYYPTKWMHEYYCEKEAGFWIYKTLDQWKAENPGVMEGLVANKGEYDMHKGDKTNFTATHVWNQRFNLVFHKSGPSLFNDWRHEQVILDSKTNEEMARFVDFSTGNGLVSGEPEMRFWLHSNGCSGSDSQAINFVKFAKQFKGVEK